MVQLPKRRIFVVSVSFGVAIVSTVIGYLILNDEGSHVASFIEGFCVFLSSLAVSFKLIALVYNRHILEEKKKKNNYSRKIDKKGNEIISITDDLSISFIPSASALYDVLPYSESKSFFYLCDIEGEKNTCDIVRRVILATLDAVDNSLELERIMQSLDKSVRLLNMKSMRISVVIGLVDTSAMKISFINASNYNLFKSKQKGIPLWMPLISNKYVLGSDKQLPFIISETSVQPDDLITVAIEGSRGD